MTNYKKKTLKEKFIDKLNHLTKYVYPEDLEEDFLDIFHKCKPYTEVSVQRMHAVYQAVKYIIDSKIEGDFVECGVYKGGCVMIMLETLLKYGIRDRKVYLYDTFKGMPKPTERDSNIYYDLSKKWSSFEMGTYNTWNYCSLENVKRNIALTNYPEENLIFIEGMVEDTIPKTIPVKIALLRLDVDFHSPTKHSLKFLFPLLESKGVLILDDYGGWKGSKDAVNEYFEEENIKMLLNRTDGTGRIGIK